MPHLERENGSLYYEVHECPLPWVQRPATILFCHGVATNADIWAGWLPTLSAHYRVVRFDTRGFGRSAVPGAGFPWSMDLLVDDVLAIAGASGTKKFHLVGESLGGTVALATAINHGTRLLSVTALSTSHIGGSIQRVREWRDFIGREGMPAWSKQMMPLRFHDGAVADQVYRWFDEVQSASSADSVLDLADLLIGTDLTRSLPSIAVPALLMAPDASPFVSLDLTREIHKLIPGCELQVFAGARHGLACSHADACSRTLMDFIERKGLG
ncbi:MAG: alpha/beta fold hydrolase [SAR324 cluster bacterium]|nr:alpha/beta fold hydrolase [SAR324 cluster bacterium]